jgi:uncharacterized protein (TIGR03437 family)
MLTGQIVHPLAQARYDRGPVEGTFRLGYIQMTFQQTPAQRADLDQLLAAQRDPASPDYHVWLTPEQYADRFGLSSTDLARITGWLRSAGFTIEYTARGRDWIAFSGTAARVEAAFHTSVHRYEIEGQTHFAVATEPSIPSDLKPLVATLLGLNDFHPKRMVRPANTSTSGNSLAPGDLATIYDINRLYTQGVDGSGQKIAIVGQTQVDVADVQQFRSNYGLGSANIKLVLSGTDPGVSPDDLVEADLDLEWAGAIARNATLIYVYSTDADSAAFYAIDQNLAPIVSESFGLCEAGAQASPLQYEAEAKKGNAMGITWIAASGDSGAAGCDYNQLTASLGLAVSFPASVPEVTAVGGTEFNEGAGTYWSATNGTNGGSALGYIPEMAWNDTGDLRDQCNPFALLPASENQCFGLAATGGGVSGFYPKPSWQVGPGVPADSQRDLPDIAMAAALHDPYNIITSGQSVQVGGTSAAAPVFAGILALLNQELKGNGVGNINPTLYELALSSPVMFHDIVNNNNIVPCASGSPNCSGNNLGYNAGVAYDLTTGLGSVDAYNLVTGWSAATAGGAAPVISSVKNAASYAAGVVSPGEMVVIFGTGLGPAQPAGQALSSSGLVSTQYSANALMSVQFNGLAAPLVNTSSTAIAATVPYEITGPSAQVTVTYQGKTSAPVTVNVAAAVPGIFTADASGQGQAAAVNSDGTRNSAGMPAAQGSTIVLYGTGEGQTSPGGVDGKLAAAPLPAPILPVSATIGGVQAIVQYAGAESGEVAGVLQLNVVVPAGVSGSSVPVLVQVGNAAAQNGVTVAVAASPGFAITSQEIAGAVIADGGGALTCSTPPAQTSFASTDALVWVYFSYSGAQNGDVIAANWLHPSGQVDSYQPSLTLNRSGSGCAAAPLKIAGAQGAQDPGNWQVKIFRNGTFEFALPFTILP